MTKKEDQKYCTICLTKIPEEDLEDDGKAYCSVNMEWFCSDDHYYDSKEEES